MVLFKNSPKTTSRQQDITYPRHQKASKHLEEIHTYWCSEMHIETYMKSLFYLAGKLVLYDNWQCVGI